RREPIRLAAVELFARNGTQTEPRLRKMDSFQNSSFCWNRKELENVEFWENSTFELFIKTQCIPRQRMFR
ncbi:MAG: hypothetical protein ACTTI5_04800, partial [Treponema sp.]